MSLIKGKLLEWQVMLSDNYTKKNHDNDSGISVKDIELSNKLGQNLSGLQMNPSIDQGNESESPGERPQTNSGEVDFAAQALKCDFPVHESS